MDAATYTAALAKFFSQAQKLTPGKTTQEDLEQFLAETTRGLSAVARALKGFDLKKMDDLQGKITMVINNNPKDPPQAVVDQTVKVIHFVVQRMGMEAKILGLIDE